MIDLDELHDKMVSYRLVGFTKSDISTIDALELIARLLQAEKDAARYKDIISDCRGVFVISGDNEMVSAIDEAMRCNK
ncbi:MAG: hypothetical protein ACRCVX_01395 [Shewanella sp.]